MVNTVFRESLNQILEKKIKNESYFKWLNKWEETYEMKSKSSLPVPLGLRTHYERL